MQSGLTNTVSDLLKRLVTAVATEESFSIVSAFESKEALENISVVAVDVDRKQFLVRFSAGRTDKWYQIRFILKVHFSNETLSSAEGESYWQKIQGRRQHWSEWKENLRTIDTPIDWSTSPSQRSAYLFGEVPATVGGKDRILYIAGNNERNKFTAFEAANTKAAERAIHLTGGSYWELASTWLSVGFVWSAWLAKPSNEITFSDNAFQAISAWASSCPSDVANMFIAKSWKEHQVVKKADHLSNTEINLLAAQKLVQSANTAPFDVILQAVSMAELRNILRRYDVKAASRNVAILWIKEHKNTILEASIRQSASLLRRNVLVPPCGLSWDDWQQFRDFHFQMVDAFSYFLNMSSSDEMQEYSLDAMLSAARGDA